MSVLFVLAAVVAVASALLAVTRRSPVYAAAWMMATLFALAGIFVLLSSAFLGTVQVLLYAGAILVLFVFVIMILNRPRQERESDAVPRGQRIAGAAVAGVLLVVLATASLGGIGDHDLAPKPAPAAVAASAGPSISAAPAKVGAEGVPFGSTAYFGRVLYDRYLVAFELISVLVLAAVACVIAVAKRELEPKDRRRNKEC